MVLCTVIGTLLDYRELDQLWCRRATRKNTSSLSDLEFCDDSRNVVMELIISDKNQLFPFYLLKYVSKYVIIQVFHTMTWEPSYVWETPATYKTLMLDSIIC